MPARQARSRGDTGIWLLVTEVGVGRGQGSGEILEAGVVRARAQPSPVRWDVLSCAAVGRVDVQARMLRDAVLRMTDVR